MIPLKKLVLVFLAAASLLTEGYCGVTNQEALAIYKDLVQKQQAGGIVGTGLEEDYVQVPSYIWSDYEIPVGVEKRDGKYKHYMMSKNSDGVAPDTANHPEPIIRSYIPRTNAKRVPGAILNWAFTPQQKTGGYYRTQAHLRPAALE